MELLYLYTIYVISSLLTVYYILSYVNDVNIIKIAVIHFVSKITKQDCTKNKSKGHTKMH